MSDDRPVTQKEQERIDKLGLAPAYKNVWVSDDPESKIQATGMDDKGRKQYRYHPDHVKEATDGKFLRLYKFVKAMPKLESALQRDMQREPLSKERVTALMLRIVQELNMRVGKECYAKTNKSYGVSSLERRHVKVADGKATFNFKAKSNKQVQYTLVEPQLVNEIKHLLDNVQDGPDGKLFQYKRTGLTESEDSESKFGRVTDADLNSYLQQHMGKEFSCKDFRTYAANFYFIKALLKETRNRKPDTVKATKQNLNAAQETTAFYLRHTKSISKKSYTMDLIRDMYLTNPDFFVENKNKQPLTVLLEVLRLFKEKNGGKKS